MHTTQTWVLEGTVRTTTKTSGGVNMMCSGWLSILGFLFGEIHDTNLKGYWTSELMVAHTNRFLDLVEARFKACDVVLMLDNR
jgi:hypothetical protein